MSTWVLVLYMSVFGGTGPTGGPAIIDGFTSLENCNIANTVIKEQIKKYDWGKCVEIRK